MEIYKLYETNTSGVIRFATYHASLDSAIAEAQRDVPAVGFFFVVEKIDYRGGDIFKYVENERVWEGCLNRGKNISESIIIEYECIFSECDIVTIGTGKELGYDWEYQLREKTLVYEDEDELIKAVRYKEHHLFWRWENLVRINEYITFYRVVYGKDENFNG